LGICINPYIGSFRIFNLFGFLVFNGNFLSIFGKIQPLIFFGNILLFLKVKKHNK